MNNLVKLSVVVFSIVAAACSSKETATPVSVGQTSPATQKTTVAATAASTTTPSQPITLDCVGVDNGSGTCTAFSELDKASAYLNAYGAEISLDLTAAQYTHSKKNSLESDYQRVIDNVASNVKNASSAMNGKSDAGIQASIDAIQDCIDILGKSRKLPPDSYDLRKDECTLRSARLLQLAKLADHMTGVTDKPDFNKLHWGDSQEIAQKAVTAAPISKTAAVLVYKQILGNHPVLMALHFTDGKLTSANYWVNEDHNEPAAYLDDFHDLDEMLADKYGKPFYSGMSWRNDLFRDDTSRYGLALASGQMRMESDWNLDAMKVAHAVYGDNYKVRHGIEYTSKEFALEVHQSDKAKASSAL